MVHSILMAVDSIISVYQYYNIIGNEAPLPTYMACSSIRTMIIVIVLTRTPQFGSW